MSTAALESEIEALRVQIESIHDSLESRSINSRRAGSLLTGEVFSVPVDAEHKAKQARARGARCTPPRHTGVLGA